MADDSSYISTILGWLRGQKPSVANLAPPLSNYPTYSDADNARKYGFSEGNENQDYLDNEKAKVLGVVGTNFSPPAELRPQTSVPLPRPDPRKESAFTPISAENMGPLSNLIPSASRVVNPGEQGLNQIDNRMMRAALAANRSPIAALGFDPSKVALDAKVDGGTLGGAYLHGGKDKYDDIYTRVTPDDSIVHESTHRGLYKLMDKYPEMQSLLQGSPNQELIVRYLMHKNAGDPEGHIPSEEMDVKQRQEGIDTYEKGWNAKEYQDNLNKIEELAIQAMKDRGRRVGPQ